MAGNGSRESAVDYHATGRTAKGVLAVVCVALFFGVLNASAVAVVLPDIGEYLTVDTGQLSWLMTGFLLVYGIAIPFYGRLGDLYGARPLFLFGVSVFSVGSLLSALAPNFELLLAARIVQAIGGAAVPGLGMTLASRAYGPEARGTVLGIVAATIGLGAAIGPLLGGALSEWFGWQSVFAVNTVAAVTIPIGFKILPRGEDRALGNLDISGGIALALLVGGILLIPSVGARSGWSSPLVLTGAVVAVIGLVGFLVRERSASSPIIPREFFRSSRYVALVCMSFSVMAANLAILIGLPILLASFHRLSALEIGLTMLPGAITTSVFGVIAGPAHRPKWSAAANLDRFPTNAFSGNWAFNICGVLGLGHCHLRRDTRSRVRISEYASGSHGIAGRTYSDAIVGAEYQFHAFLSRGQPRSRHGYGCGYFTRRGQCESIKPLALGRSGWLQRCISAIGHTCDPGHGAIAGAA